MAANAVHITIEGGAAAQELRERLLDLVSCAGRPKVWDRIAAEVAQLDNLELLRAFALDESASWNVRALAARMYARVVEGRHLAHDPVLNHTSATLREEAMMGAADRGSRVLLERFAKDPVKVIAEGAQEYLDDLPSA